MLGWELPPHNSGGLGVACYQLCHALAKKGADIEFILPYTAPHSVSFMKVTAASKKAPTELLSIGIAYDSFKYVVPGSGSYSISPGNDLFRMEHHFTENVAKLVKIGEYDVLHAHDWLTFRAALKLKETSNIPFIAHVHALEYDRSGGGRGNPLVRDIEATALSIADRVIAVSDRTKKTIVEEYNVPADKIDVIYNGINISDSEESATQNAYTYLLSMKERGYKIVSNVGRLTLHKGLTNLLRSFHLVVQHQPKTLLLLVGDGEQRDELIELAAELGISRNVFFAGYQRGERWRSAFQVADLFVLPSISEPFGLTPLEAAMYGTPSLISKQSGVAEIFRNCLKVDFWDVDGMANKIVGALQSRTVLDVLTANAQAEITGINWSNAADGLMAVYAKRRERLTT